MLSNSMSWGDAYALLTAVSWSFALILFRIGSFKQDTIPLKLVHNAVALVFFALSLPLLAQPLWMDITFRQWTLVIVSALLGITIGDTFHMAALRRLGPGRTAVLDCLYSPFVLIFAYLFDREMLTSIELLGASLILFGVGLSALEAPHHQNISRKDFWIGTLFATLTAASLALCVMMVRDILPQTSVLTMTAYRFLAGTVLLIVWSLLRGHSIRYLTQGFSLDRSFGWNVVAGFLGPYLSTVLWFLGFKYTLAGRAAFLNQSSSIFVLLLARVILKEPLYLHRVLAVVVALIGIVVLTLARSASFN